MRKVVVFLFLLLLLIQNSALKQKKSPKLQTRLSGEESYEKAEKLFRQKKFDEAADAYWYSIINPPKNIEIQTLFQSFMKVFQAQRKLELGYLYIAEQYLKRGETKNGLHYIEQANEIKPTSNAYMLLIQYFDQTGLSKEQIALRKTKYLTKAVEIEPNNPDLLIRVSHVYYELKSHDKALEVLDKACELDPNRSEAFANAVYLRSNICVWGPEGRTYKRDMEKIISIVSKEMNSSMLKLNDISQQSVVHPHMSLGYPIPPLLKLAIAKSHASAERVLVTKAGLIPTDHASLLDQYRMESELPGFRLKVGFVSANIKSKTTVYMARDLLGFLNSSRYEVHIYATTGPDTDQFLSGGMRGVDWREHIRERVEYFHDVHSLDVQQLNKQILEDGIHVLLNWDGYSNNGVRSTGLFPLQPSPIQIAHQEYIGTMGAEYIQYIITDQTASPLEHESHYSEKFIYMPHSFLANSFPFQVPEMSLPRYVLSPRQSPQRNACDQHRFSFTDAYQLATDFSWKDSGEDDREVEGEASFVYCNFNKQLKFNPTLFLEWLKLLEEVEDSILCLLENPADSIPHLTSFIQQYNPSLVSRVRFQQFYGNPYDNQRRVVALCNAILDTPTYNGHTTAVDALWGAVPVLTLGNDLDMSGRVGMSILTALNVSELIAIDQNHYNQLAKELAMDENFYQGIRKKLVDAAFAGASSLSSSTPRTPYWDLLRYTRNLENAFDQIWSLFLSGHPPTHIYVQDQGPQAYPKSLTLPALAGKKNYERAIKTRPHDSKVPRKTFKDNSESSPITMKSKGKANAKTDPQPPREIHQTQSTDSSSPPNPSSSTNRESSTPTKKLDSRTIISTSESRTTKDKHLKRSTSNSTSISSSSSSSCVCRSLSSLLEKSGKQYYLPSNENEKEKEKEGGNGNRKICTRFKRKKTTQNTLTN